jgi:hypothetical protein
MTVIEILWNAEVSFIRLNIKTINNMQSNKIANPASCEGFLKNKQVLISSRA